jgi:hypothetical protein
MRAPGIILPGHQRTPEWYSAKAGRITGTRFAAAMAGVDTAAYQNLVTDLAWERVFGPDDPADRFVSKAMQGGIEFEAEAFDWYAFTTDNTCQQPMFVIHGVHAFVGVSPDLLVNGDGMAQIKCPQRRGHLTFIRKPRLPAEYKWQVHGEIWTCDRDWSDFVSYHPVLRGSVLRVERDETLIAQLEERCLQVNAEAEELAQHIHQLKEAA